MKTSFLSKLLLLSLCSISLFSIAQQSDAPDINFTDLNGTSHNLYTYLDSGYTVVLDFSYEQCYPCYDWSINVGHDLWSDHGPGGDNTIRMFHFDVLSASDQEVSNYTEEWGVEYPVINLEDDLSEYPSEGYPSLFYICPDKSFNSDGGYGYPISQIAADVYLEQCKGNEIFSSINFLSASPAISSTICNSSPTYYIPKLYLVNNGMINSTGESGWIDSTYEIEIFINGIYHSVQDVDPLADDSFSSEDQPTLNPIPVESNDVLTLICHYPGDEYANDDTVFVTIPAEINTPISTSTSLEVNIGGGLFKIKDSDGNNIVEDQSEFTLEVDSCYSILFTNSHIESGTLKDANGVTLVSFEAGDFEGYETPWLYFHVSDTVSSISMNEYNTNKTLLSVDYLDVLGRRYSPTDFGALTKGVYFELRHYSNGEVEIKKQYNPFTH